MKRNNLFSYLIGGMFALAFTIGLLFLVAWKPITISTAVTILCLSIASGLLIPNPISFYGLIVSICMLVLPSRVVGIIFVCIGIAGSLINMFISKSKIQKP